jgi:predicted nuclease with TOPRIM domain
MTKEKDQEINSMVQSSTMLLSFEGWIKYVEGFSRGLQTTKTVDAREVFDCVGEIMEYMKSLKGQIMELLLHCESVLEKEEIVDSKIVELEEQTRELIQENQNLAITNEKLENENIELKKALEQLAETMKEKQNGKVQKL